MLMYLVRKTEDGDEFELLMQKIEDGDFDTLTKRYMILRGSPEFVLELLDEKGHNADNWYKTASDIQETNENCDLNIGDEIDEYLVSDRIISCVLYYDEIQFENDVFGVTIMIANEDSILLQFVENSICGFNKMYFNIDRLPECDFDEYIQMSCNLKYGEMKVK